MSTGRRTSKRPRGESEASTDSCAKQWDRSNAGQDVSSTQPLRKRRKASGTDAHPRVEEGANKLAGLRRDAERAKQALDESRRKFLADKKNDKIRLEFQRMMEERKKADLALKRALSALRSKDAQQRKSLTAINVNSNQVNSNNEALREQMEAVLQRAAEKEKKHRKRFEYLGDKACSFCNREGHTPDCCPLKTMAPHLLYGDPGVGGNNMPGCDWDKREKANWNRRN